MPSLLSLLAILSPLFLLFKLLRSGKREKYLPPGPPTYPVLGNIPSLSLDGLHFKFTEWVKQYGDIYSLKIGSTTMVILNSIETVHQIIEKNTAYTSDRPRNYMADIVTGANQPYMLLTPYSTEWKNQRRAMHELFQPQACLKYIPVEKAEIYQLGVELLKNPHNLKLHIRRMALSSMLTLAYGVRVTRATSPLFVEYEQLVDSWISLILKQGAQVPVDAFPFLKYIPETFAYWKKVAKEVRRKQIAVSYGMLEMVEKRVAIGEGNGCFMEVLLEDGSAWGLGRDSINYLGQVILDGNWDTTSGAIETFILYMTAYPDVQQRAQQEIDTVIGKDRMPTLDDIHRLPYLVAAILETYRLRPPVPTGIPHFTTSSINYNNYHIPAKTTLILNIWAIFRDEKIFPNAEIYNPERFLTNPETAKIIDYVFGAGRRICPGISHAKNSVYLTVMTLLWCFNIHKARDAAGNEIEVDLNAFSEEHIVMQPEAFECNIRPRSAKHEEMLCSEFGASERDVRAFEVGMSEEDADYLKSLREEYL